MMVRRLPHCMCNWLDELFVAGAMFHIEIANLLASCNLPWVEIQIQLLYAISRLPR